jgi:hypothetical protein
VSLGPREKKVFDLETEASDDIKDGTAELEIIAADRDFNIFLTNILKIKTMHLARPALQVFFTITNINTVVYTNEGPPASFEMPLIKIFNCGEADATNLNLYLKVEDVTNEGLTNVLQNFHYRVPVISTNAYMNLLVPDVLTDYMDFTIYTWNISGGDGNKLLSIDTNLAVESGQ